MAVACPAVTSRSEHPAQRRWHRAVVLGAALALAAGLGACKQEEQAAEAPQPVRIMTVTSEPLAKASTYVGTVKARYESDLGFRVGGKVIERLVNVGDAVVAGQELARLDVTDLRLGYEANEAERAAARSNLTQAFAAERRGKDLLDRGHISTAIYDQRKAALDEAQGRLERAERNVALSRNQTEYATLRADQAGLVTALPVEVGQVVTAGQLVVRLARNGDREVVVAIPEVRLADIRQTRTEIELWADAGKRRYPGRLREVTPQADAVTRTYQARFTIDAPDNAAVLGMTANVITTSGDATRMVRVPASAIINNGDGVAVWIVEDGTRVKRRPVTVQAFGQQEALVTSGLAEGERIVTLGVHILDEARAVRVVEERPLVKMAADRAPVAK